MRHTKFEYCFVPMNVYYSNDRCLCNLHLQTAVWLICAFEFIYCAAFLAFGAIVEHHFTVVYHSIILFGTVFLLAGRLLHFKLGYKIFIVFIDLISWLMFFLCGVLWTVYALTGGQIGWDHNNYRWSLAPVRLQTKAAYILLGVFFIFMFVVQHYFVSVVYGAYKYLKNQERREVVIVDGA